jgi:uncharacterized protein
MPEEAAMTQEHVVENRESLDAQVLDMHRALTSLIDQLGALDMLNQRFAACTDPELKLVLASQRDSTRKHVAMLVEWARRRDPKLDKELRDALFKAGPIAAQYRYDENM